MHGSPPIHLYAQITVPVPKLTFFLGIKSVRKPQI
uniref:Uncharacterized protein n=1 Tax=Rhizophora mucronata TaxID=61149 RepID=A0A2P2QWF3_RHIMU